MEDPKKYIEFDKVVLYESPIDVKTKLDKLSFIPENRQKWGMVFMNGCRKISSADYISLTEV
jgi:predicted RNA-binding protein